MADRIDKIRLGSPEPLDAYEVEAMRDALDEEKNNKNESEDDGDVEMPDAFRKETNKNLPQLKARTDANPMQELNVRDVSKAWFHSIDLKTEPSALYLKLKLRSTREIWLVQMSVTRAMALSFKSQIGNKPVHLEKYFKDATLWVQFLQNLSEPEEEVTRISMVDEKNAKAEKTLSQTFKMRRDMGFWKRIGVVQSESSRLNLEVILAYLIAFIVCLFLFFGILYLST